MANWKKVLVSGSSIEVANISASGDLIVKNIPNNDGSGINTLVYDTTSGKIFYTGSYGGGGGGDSFFTEFATDNIRTENNVFITGAATLAAAPAAVSRIATQSANNYALLVSQSAYFYNHNVGYPTSNAWGQNLQGSYFNTFTANTDVSEVLRFLAGLLSSSAPSPSPNTRTYSNLTSASAATNLGVVNGRIPGGSTNNSVLYFISRGFGSIGTLFIGNTGFSNHETNSNFALKYTSTAGGSTSVSSSADAQLFGLGELTSGNATTFNVSGTLNWVFEDNNSQIATATSKSEQLLSTNTFGTTNGLTLGRISTTNPAVIPPQYQDGKFASIFSQSLYTGGIIALTNISSSGFYKLSASIAISSGSSAYSSPINARARLFYAPVNNINTALGGTHTLYFNSLTTSSLTAVSNSLSGAPYLRNATWNITQRISGAFDPLYDDNITHIFSDDDSNVSLAALGAGSISCNINSSGFISTANSVFSSTTGQVRSTGTYPSASDVIQLSASATFNLTTTSTTNITINGISPTTFTITNTAYNRDGTAYTSNQAFSYHKAGEFNQPTSSGSMAYYGFPAPLTLTATSETFNDEANRIVLDDNILTFAGTAFNSGSRLASKELQVKPGYLVYPGGSRTYWYPTIGDTFKYYVRKFRRTTSINTFTLNLGQALIAWDDTSTTTSPAIAIVFESAVNGQNGLTRTRLFDPYYTTGLRTNNIAGGTDGTNPFGSAIDYYGIRTGAVSGTTYTIEISNANAVYMNGSTYDEFYVIIRYKAEPTSAVTTLSVSAGS
jgi:hypothetical protein